MNNIEIPSEISNTPLTELPITRGRFNKKTTGMLQGVIDEAEIAKMQELGVDKRMILGINPHYLALATGEELQDSAGNVLLPKMPPSASISALVMPRVNESFDISGEKDPSNQNHYSPDELKGKLLHKYDEIVLGYSALACSAHCRYCYRLDLFNGDTGKTGIKPEDLRDYIASYNGALKEAAENTNQEFGKPITLNINDIAKYPVLAGHGAGEDAENESRIFYPITETLLSGGDPLVLNNANLYKFLAAGAEAGVNVVRIGTKELAFRPERVDDNFINIAVNAKLAI